MEPITLPSGATAVLRSPQQVTERVRKPYMRLQRQLAASDLGKIYKAIKDSGRDKPNEEETRQIAAHPDYDLVGEIDDALIAALVASWSYDGIPVTVDGVTDIPLVDKLALLEKVRPLAPILTPDFAATPDSISDPGSPTG